MGNGNKEFIYLPSPKHLVKKQKDKLIKLTVYLMSFTPSSAPNTAS